MPNFRLWQTTHSTYIWCSFGSIITIYSSIRAHTWFHVLPRYAGNQCGNNKPIWTSLSAEHLRVAKEERGEDVALFRFCEETVGGRTPWHHTSFDTRYRRPRHPCAHTHVDYYFFRRICFYDSMGVRYEWCSQFRSKQINVSYSSMERVLELIVLRPFGNRTKDIENVFVACLARPPVWMWRIRRTLLILFI